MGARAVVTAVLLVGTGPLGGDLAAQTPGEGSGLAGRVAEVEGRGAFRVPLLEGVEVCEDGVVVDDGRQRWGRWSDGRAGACSTGTAEVVVEVEGGRVRSLDLEPWEGPGSGPAGTDLGAAAAADAASFLTGLALGRGLPAASREAAGSAIMISVLLPDVEVWPDLLAVARDRDLEGDLRRSALFWLSRVAAQEVTRGILDVAEDDSEDQDVRDAAVFALSQRPADEAVPALMDLVRTAPHAKTRRRALFWLSQIEDPRVVDFFEEILVGSRSGG